MTKHTPGPWSILELTVETDDSVITRPIQIFASDGQDGIANIRIDNPRCKPNASLIAAAPELLEACKALQMEAAARGCGLRIADEAIAKAEGTEVTP